MQNGRLQLSRLGGGEPVWEASIYTFTPQNIVAGKTYFADIYVSMNTGYAVGDYLAQESELYDDGWCAWPCFRPEPADTQLDYWKQWLGSY